MILASGWARFTRRVALRHVLADRESRKAFKAALGGRVSDERTADELVELKLRPLQGHSVWIRAGTSDPQVLLDTFVHGFHRPPPLPLSKVSRIWDLGSNIGLTMIDLALRFPCAEIVGVELDANNAQLGSRNVSPWSDRCRTVEAAIWPTEEDLYYRRWPGSEYGSAVVPVAQWDSPVADLPTRAMSLNTLLRSHGDEKPVDYVKMDIEGAERFVLRENTEWASWVACISVELHPPYTLRECVRDLENTGFRATVNRERPPCVVGVKSARGADLLPDSAKRSKRNS